MWIELCLGVAMTTMPSFQTNMPSTAVRKPPVQLQTIHRRLFDQVPLHAGTYRTYNTTKREWVLKDGTVCHASADSIEDTLRYDFGLEREFSYAGLSGPEVG